MEYNQNTCITAGELRSLGVELPADIPDCAWVTKNSFGNFNISKIEDGLISMKMSISEPFTWYTAEIEIEIDMKGNIDYVKYADQLMMLQLQSLTT